MTASALSGGASSPAHRGHHLREAVGRGHQRARAMLGGRDGVGFADLEHVLEAMRELGDAADAEDVGRALERVRGALGIAQQVGLRGSRRSSR